MNRNDNKNSPLEALLIDLEEKANAATPGPWEPTYDDVYPDILRDVGPLTAGEYQFDSYKNMNSDANFICAANPDTIKKLIAVISIMLNEASDNARSVCEKIVSGK